MATKPSFLPRRLWKSFDNQGDVTEHVKSILAVVAGNPKYVTFVDDFVGSPTGTWPANANWSYPATVGTGTEVIGITAATNGTLTCTTGGTSGNGAYQYLGLNWKPANGFYACWYAKANSTSTCKFEIGMTDSITNEGIINAKATPTFTATDGAAFVFDTSDNTSLAFIGVNNGALGNDSGATDTIGTMDSSYHWYELVSYGGKIIAFFDGRRVGATSVTSTATLGPQIGGATTRAASTATTTVDFCLVTGPRLG